MPAHALVTRLSRRPDPAAALARDRVTWSGEGAPQGTLTLLAAAARHLRVTVVTGSTPVQRGTTRREKEFTAIVMKFPLILMKTENEWSWWEKCVNKKNSPAPVAKVAQLQQWTHTHQKLVPTRCLHASNLLHHVLRNSQKYFVPLSSAFDSFYVMISKLILFLIIANTQYCDFLCVCVCLTSHSICPHIPQDRRYIGSHQIPPLHRSDWN